MTKEEISVFWASIDEAASNAPEAPYSHAKIKELIRVAWKLKEQNTDQRAAIQELVEALRKSRDLLSEAKKCCITGISIAYDDPIRGHIDLCINEANAALAAVAEKVPRRSKMTRYELFQDKNHPEDWRVEHIDPKSGDVFVTIFCGPLAKERASEYAAFKEQRLQS